MSLFDLFGFLFVCIFFLSSGSFTENMQAPLTSVELLGDASEVDVSLQEIGNQFEVFTWGGQGRNIKQVIV